MTHLVGGISSAGRALPTLDGEALLIASSAGPYVWDTRGRRYVDTAMGFGGSILGHAPPEVMEAAAKALRDGPLPAFAHPAEEAAAAALADHTGPLDRVLFTNTGSEAVHLACRAARVATGRKRIAKIAAGYDGWFEDVSFGQAGAPESLLSRNRRPETDRIVLLRFNDPADTDALFAEHDDIAAVLVEPMMANAGCIMPRPGYLEHLVATARRHGALVIFDEVLTGFRLHAGLACHAMGLDCDLATLGKAIGSGIAVAAVVGRGAVMDSFADGRANRAGTYSGNPVASAAVLATMKVLGHADYPALLARGASLRDGLAAAFAAEGLPCAISGFDDVFSLWFADQAPETYADAHRLARPDLSLALHLALRRLGALVIPSCYGRLYLSFAHDDAAVAELLAAVAAAAPMLARGDADGPKLR